MKTLKAILFMSIWTLSIMYTLYLFEAHLYYQNIFIAGVDWYCFVDNAYDKYGSIF